MEMSIHTKRTECGLISIAPSSGTRTSGNGFTGALGSFLPIFTQTFCIRRMWMFPLSMTLQVSETRRPAVIDAVKVSSHRFKRISFVHTVSFRHAYSEKAAGKEALSAASVSSVSSFSGRPTKTERSSEPAGASGEASGRICKNDLRMFSIYYGFNSSSCRLWFIYHNSHFLSY